MANIKSIINMHKKELITEKKTQAVECNCINKPDWSLFYGTSEGTFKQCYGNHKKSFNHEKHRTDTELLKESWRLKELKAQPQVQFYILKSC